ncbi:guanine nucleotide releasing protein [Trypanosoma rangeli]|uniref:Guanine nucleotide releasing protein n=1 Tax=Trypanosoma rangeli TaxID=5698 RepID=A0A422NX77_TRYRA|nr:guanine nucleotide releasing protein [Trypanosoma rangeli]RNF10036.1 guanine nucleotide releasing protein [Trypanosoma rangeli]|eukprot:RNF10036.1 guanine nucleotide releasing protein [Trypanosoma rangeli]
MVAGTSAGRGLIRLYVRMEGLIPFALLLDDELTPEALEHAARHYVRDRYGPKADADHRLVRRINFAGSDVLMDFAHTVKPHSPVRPRVDKKLTEPSSDGVGNGIAFVKVLPAYHDSNSPEAIRASCIILRAPILNDGAAAGMGGGGAAALIPSSTYMAFIGFHRLVLMMTDPRNPQRDLYTRVALLTYRQFVTPDELLGRLIERHDVPAITRPGAGVRSALEQHCYQELRREIQSAVFSVLELWVKSYYEDFSSDALHSRLLTFARAKADQAAAPAALLRLMADGDRTALCYRAPAMLLGVPQQGETPTSVLLHYSPREIATQLTILTSYLHRQLTGPELLGQRWETGEASLIPNFIQYRDFISRFTNWVSCAVVAERDLTRRRENVASLLLLCDELIKLRNWDILVAAYKGMQAPAVERMRHTWASLPKNAVELSSRLKKLLDYDAGHKTLRETMRKRSQLLFPCIPIFFQELRELEETKRIQEGLVNFGCCLQQYLLLQTLLQGKEVAVDHLVPNKSLMAAFFFWRPVETSLLMQLSNESEKP